MAKAAEFGMAVAGLLRGRHMTQERLAKAVGRSQSYTNQILNGQRTPSAEWADLVADALALPAEERQKLHAAAARDNGFKIELPEFS
jgi:transcriptional regulator with XRE-family HTH domain